MNSSNSVSGASPSIAPPTRSIVVLLADGSRLRVTCRELAAQLRQERGAALKRLRQARAEAKAEVADRIDEARIRRELEASEREMDAAIRRLSKQVRIKPEPRRSSSPAQPSRTISTRAGHSGVIVTRGTTSALARRDRLGREGIMLRIRYVRAGGKHASPGCLRRHWRYIAREAAVTLDSEGREIVLSNLGETIDDVADALGLQEQVLREMRKNAKLGFRMIGAFPYGMSVDARREFLQRLGDELFGARDLPWSAAAHDSDPDAKVDNPHFHLDYGLLPMARQADGSFIVSNDLRTDLDGQEGLRFIRHTVARVMTKVAQEHGLDRSFTALSYRERGMDRDGGEHVGQEGTAAHRRGEHVATIARNEAKRRRAEAKDRAHQARERLAALERLKRAVAAMPVSPHLANEPAGVSVSAIPALVAAPVAADPIVLSDIPGMIPTPDIVPAEIMSATTITAPQLGASPPAFAVVERPAPVVASSPPVGDIPRSISLATPSPVLPPLIAAAIPAPATPPTPSFAAMPPPATPVDDTKSAIARITASVTSSTAPSLAGMPLVIDVQHDAAPVLMTDFAPLTTVTPTAAPSWNDRDVGIVIDFARAPLIAVLPPVSVFVAAADVVAGPSATIDIGLSAPITVAPPAVARTNRAAPYMAAMEVPYAEAPAAPHIDAVPALAQVGKPVADIAPPPVTLIGTPARYPHVAEPIVWSIGKPALIDPDERLIEQRLAEVLEREEARHRDMDVGEAAERDRQIAEAAAFEALRRHDEWPGQDERGYYTVSKAVLRASGLSRADLDTPAAQAALEAIGFSQVDRLDPVLNDRSGQSPFRIEDGAIRLDDRFPAELRDDVARWSDHLPFRALVGRVWPALREAVAPAPAVPANPSVVPEGPRHPAVNDLLAAIAEDRHYLAQEQGVPVVDPHLLTRFGLSPTDVAGDDVRKRLAGLADRQAAEVSQIAIHVQKSPHDIVPDGDGWRLADDAPADIRMLVAAWRNNATIQQALGGAVAARPVEAPARSVAESVGDQPGAAWRRARLARERAMAESDAIERRDGDGLTQPGRRIAQPGAEETASASRVTHRFRGLPDPGLGA